MLDLCKVSCIVIKKCCVPILIRTKKETEVLKEERWLQICAS